MALAPAVAEDQRPNIILIMADDLGWGDPGFNGGTVAQTPHLDAMADAGLKFNRFYSASPVCSPTRGSALTGRHPFRYGIRFANGGHLKPQEITLAEVLRDAGYATGHFGKWHLGTLTPDYSGKPDREPEKNHSDPGMNGFDTWFSTEFAVSTWDPYDPANSHLGKNVPPDVRALYWRNGVNVEGGLEGDDSRIMMDEALPFMEKAIKNQKPFFSVIWLHAPHAPVVGGPDYRARYGSLPEDAQHYFATITALDEQVGRLRGALRDWGVAENTILFFCSDNGPEGDEPGERNMGSSGPFKGRKRSLFEGGVRVPGIVEWPGKVAPGATDYPAVTSDYMPTILESLGLSLPDSRPLDGVSLLPVLLEGRTERPSPIAFETIGQAGSLQTRNSPALAITDNRYKLLTDLSESGAEDLLYDLVKDPGETTNRAPAEPERVRALKSALVSWRASCTASASGGDY